MRLMAAVAVAALLILGVATPAGASGPVVPFRASMTVSATAGQSCGGSGGSVTTYIGTMAHVGRVVLEESVCYVGFHDAWIDFTVSMTYEAINGAELYATATGSFNTETGATVGEGFDIVGGTGRFDDVVGHGETMLLFDDAYNVVGLEQTGTLSY